MQPDHGSVWRYPRKFSLKEFSEVREPPGRRLRPAWPDPVDWSTRNESGG